MRMTRGFHDVNFRLLVIPSEPLAAGGMIPISATKEDIRAEIDIGRKDGLRIAKEWVQKNRPEGITDSEDIDQYLYPDYDFN